MRPLLAPLRPADLVVRLGGGEVDIFLPRTSMVEAAEADNFLGKSRRWTFRPGFFCLIVHRNEMSAPWPVIAAKFFLPQVRKSRLQRVYR